MSHEVKYFDYSLSMAKQTIEDRLDHYVALEDYQEGGGLEGPIRWIERIFETREDAMRYIESIDKGNYDQIAVQYKSYSNIRIDSKALVELREKARQASIKAHEAAHKFHFDGIKSKSVTCPRCESRLTIAYLKTNACPVCWADLRPQSTLDRLASLRKSADAATAKAKEQERKELKKHEKEAEIRWLVKIEYHM